MNPFLHRAGRPGFLFEGNDGAGSGAGSAGAEGSGQEGEGGEELTFDSWSGTWDDKQKAVFEAHVAGLKNGLASERTEKKALADQVRALQGKAEKGSELETQLNSLQASLEEANTRAEFAEEAIKEKVADPKLAYLAAKEGGFLDAKGRINWAGLRDAHPALFNSAPGRSDRGDTGTGAGGTKATDMNAQIRQAAGRV
jgi:hypothetical protein